MTHSEQAPSRSASAARGALHPRNLHQGRYDFAALTCAHPPLSAFVRANPLGEATVDFSDPAAVKALNAALLAHHYGIRDWDIPEGFLCPPIPGRADYLHHLADLLADGNDGTIPQGATVCGLDVGTGANAIYPLLGQALFGWRFIATELDAGACTNARRLFSANAHTPGALALREQSHPADVLANALRREERVDFTLCNPPFHASLEDAAAGSQRKRRNLGLERADVAALNFAGRHHELWCEGGEREFIRRMIRQSVALAANVLWFSTLVSRRDNLAAMLAWITHSGAREHRVLDMAQGQKSSRAVAWTFLTRAERLQWARQRWR